jgi:putative phosphotransacetylase
VEFSISDVIHLGLKPPSYFDVEVRGSNQAVLIGPQGRVILKQGIVVPQRHLHIQTSKARLLNIKEGELVEVKVGGKRKTTFYNVKARVDRNSILCLHLDSDEGNACGITKKGEGTLLSS